MDELSEQEQWENLKRWVRVNGPQIAIMVAVMLIGWYGWKWWQSRGDQQAEAASAAYANILATFDADKNAEAIAMIETLRNEYPKSPYVDAADLVAARVMVDSNQLDKAAATLARVATGAQDPKLRPIARIRLARVQSALGNYDEALATLGDEPLGPEEAARLEARGDILLAKGEQAAALDEYIAARKLQGASGIDEDAGASGTAAELLDLKISDLKGAVPASAPEAATPATPATPAAPAAPAAPEQAPAAQP